MRRSFGSLVSRKTALSPLETSIRRSSVSALIVAAFLGSILHATQAKAGPAIRILLPASLQRLAVDPRIHNGRTQFEVLQNDFDSARGLSIREIRGWYSGRCYYADSPTRPVASLLAVEAKPDNRHGPAFTSADFRRVIPLVSSEAASDYFDSLNPEKTRAITSALARLIDANAYPVSSNSTLVVDGLRTVDFEARQYLLRRSGRFVVLRMNCSETTYCLNYYEGVPMNRVVANEGESPVACYYFKRIRR